MSGVTRYEFQQRKAGASWPDTSPEVTVQDTDTMYTITGLDNGTRYQVRLRAYNSRGPGPWATVVSGETPANTATPTPLTDTPTPTIEPPHPPVILWDAKGDGQITIRYVSVSGITRYEFQHRKAGANWPDTSPVVTVKDTDTTYTITGLENGVTYDFRMRAINDGGNSAWAEIEVALPANTPTPTIKTPSPPVFSRLVGGAGQVTIHYAAVSGVTRYEFQHRKAGANWPDTSPVVTVKDTDTTYTITGLETGVTYEFRMRAINDGGNSAWAEIEVALPANTPTPTIKTPSPPVFSRLVGGAGQVTIHYAAVSGVTRYEFQHRKSGESWPDTSPEVTVKDTDTTYTIT